METCRFGAADPIDFSALVLLQSEDDERWYFIAPAGGGRRLQLGELVIDVITPEAPLGRALAGRVQGDDLEVRFGSRQRELSIVKVR
jgi:hypothetical protein